MTGSGRLALYAATAPGLEPILGSELERLGIGPASVEPGGITCEGTPADLVRMNLELRTANRVLVGMGEFQARHFSTLERKARKLPWTDYLRQGTPVHFRVTSRKSKLYHEDAIGERLRAVADLTAGAGPPVAAGALDELERDVTAVPPVQRFVVRVLHDRVTISADSSGARLHRRGYRLAATRAPLRETLAAAMVLGSRWDGDLPLADPFAGSGTIPIEAALIARRIAPGLARAFALERWPALDPSLMTAARDAARARVRPRAGVPITGSDRDAGAVLVAADNARRAGVAGDIEFARRTVSAFEPSGDGCLVVTNPPYGERVGDVARLRDLYARFGAVLRERLSGARVTVLVAHPAHRHAFGLELDPLFETANGGIPITCLSGPIPADR